MQSPTDQYSGQTPPSPWILRFVPVVAEGASVLDLACGSGRHGRLFLSRGHAVTFVDKDCSKLADLHSNPDARIIEADLESKDWPLAPEIFGAIVVTNYLWRPRFETLLGHLNGILIYETFADGNEQYGRPSNPDFLLDRGELFERMRGRARVLAYEQKLLRGSNPAMVQRLAAYKSK
ncbi:MAG TPA: SAM-dependent methyltransferase [Rhodospirillaceae bacterium]|nr:SAM-dependent methyltransferase [Rhodospirillaceae bacterium]HAA92326.1 SAM-dependent methyltransferase [Rhodospirillaceae bacterium]HAT36353.1 SAM-dependent methyltransferase [Rhodospirillaceae bacterium]